MQRLSPFDASSEVLVQRLDNRYVIVIIDPPITNEKGDFDQDNKAVSHWLAARPMTTPHRDLEGKLLIGPP